MQRSPSHAFLGKDCGRITCRGNCSVHRPVSGSALFSLDRKEQKRTIISNPDAHGEGGLRRPAPPVPVEGFFAGVPTAVSPASVLFTAVCEYSARNVRAVCPYATLPLLVSI